ncbi:MAG TPA: carboxylesterase family protein, partial [Xanthomonadales bacterium]|nr:carboxylesterase family protein [Xanthomonadales bacterium]
MNRRELISSATALAMLGALPALAKNSSVASHPLANTRHGQVRGYLSGGLAVFKGIRYGADTAAHRFMPPRPPEPWAGVADALEYGPAAPQANSRETISEDCLFLNVWTPDTDSRALRPVMFYIHGGAYSHGSGSHPQYDGAELCRRGDVVVVTVNHRLNAFGYLYLQGLAGTESGPEPDLGLADSGNVGQLDLVLALRWVQDNIANFGGDPDRVLAFGQSGGGAKIAAMMAMPAAQGLFQRVATMSGQQVTASGPANATARSRAFMQ